MDNDKEIVFRENIHLLDAFRGKLLCQFVFHLWFNCFAIAP